jgi:hypothetical protein
MTGFMGDLKRIRKEAFMIYPGVHLEGLRENKQNYLPLMLSLPGSGVSVSETSSIIC